MDSEKGADYLYYTALGLGVFQLSVWALRTLTVLNRTLFGVRATTSRYGENSWAIVTGSTDGIGKAAAIYLAQQGFNIVLISRTLSKLQAVAKEVEEAGSKAGKKVKTKVIANDWTKNFDSETHESMYQTHLKDLDISILINNVGMADAGDFIDLTEQ